MGADHDRVFGAVGALEIGTGGLATPIVLEIGLGVAAYTYTFDADLVQRSATITDQIRRVTQWTWNEDQQPASHTDAEGNVWRLEWNAMRQLVSTTDPAGNMTRFEYDERGRQTCGGQPGVERSPGRLRRAQPAQDVRGQTVRVRHVWAARSQAEWAWAG
ncbi:RHS repeat domain-containing protein [Burkholderia orbicola]|uniref:RHS repeat domain-containing protein n=1 Tax=Burkholderia orbicola TaxID=2978683 RepID=UPI001F2AA375|nr:RHS repeat domain-containing protein [Burkholderia orbicola]